MAGHLTWHVLIMFNVHTYGFIYGHCLLPEYLTLTVFYTKRASVLTACISASSDLLDNSTSAHLGSTLL